MHTNVFTTTYTWICCVIEQFYASVAEVESWMNDKKPLVSSEDYGKDEDTAETLIKKHEVIEKDIIGI